MADAATTGKVGTQTDPYRMYNFLLQIPGIADARFTTCRGLAIHVEPIRYRESGTGQIVRALPGQVLYDNLVLGYGVTKSRDLWDWFVKSVKGTVDRRNISVIMLDPDGVTEALRWNLLAAWPCEMRIAGFDAMGREVAIEELHIAYDSLDKA